MFNSKKSFMRYVLPNVHSNDEKLTDLWNNKYGHIRKHLNIWWVVKGMQTYDVYE